MKDENKSKAQLIAELKKYKQIEETLRQERDFAEGIIKTAQVIILVLDTQGRIVRFNPFMEELSGYRLEEAQGKDWFSTFLPKRDHDRIRALFQQAIGNVQTWGNVNPIITKDGRERQIEWYDTTLKGGEGQVTGLLAIGQDITERLQAEIALRQAHEELDRRVKERTSELEQVNKSLTLEIAERKQAEENLQANEQQLRAIINNMPMVLSVIDRQGVFTLSEGQGLELLGFKPGQVVGLSAFEMYKNHPEIIDSFNKALTGERVIFTGELGDLFYKAIYSPLTDQDDQIVGAICIGFDITELRQIGQQLNEAKKRYHTLFIQSPYAVIIVDPETLRPLECNRVMLRLLGYTWEAFAQLPIDHHLPPEELEDVKAHIQNVLNQGWDEFETQVLTRRGERREILVNVQSLELSGQKVLQVIAQDITGRKQAEAKLQASEERLKAQYDGIPIPTYTYQRQGDDFVLIDYNYAVEVMTQGGIVKFLGTTLSETIKHRPDLQANVWQCFNEKTTHRKEISYQFQSTGESRYLMASYVFVPPDLVMVHTEDITERKQAEEQLKRSLQEKEVLLYEIHHRVKNNLQIVSSLLYLQTKKFQNDRSIEMFKESERRIKSMALVHELLYQSKQLRQIDFGVYIRNLVNYLFQSYGITSTITLQIEAQAILLGIEQAIPCGLIINELVSNALKHAFPLKKSPGPAGTIYINLYQDAEQRLILMVRDNGVGFPPDFNLQNINSLGLQLVKNLVNQLDGDLAFTGNGGVECKITLPATE
jgi:PAS domain S-box-containing protein